MRQGDFSYVTTILRPPGSPVPEGGSVAHEEQQAALISGLRTPSRPLAVSAFCIRFRAADEVASDISPFRGEGKTRHQPDLTDHVATPVVALRASVKPSGTTTAGPGKIESQGALQNLPRLTIAASAPVIEIAAARPVTLVPPVTVGPIFERRPLTSQEKNWLLDIMQKRALSRCDVMDELELLLNGSLWMAISQGTTVSEEMLERLSDWFEANSAHIQRVA